MSETPPDTQTEAQAPKPNLPFVGLVRQPNGEITMQSNIADGVLLAGMLATAQHLVPGHMQQVKDATKPRIVPGTFLDGIRRMNGRKH